MRSTWIIARLTYREAASRWILWAALLLGGVFLVVFGIGFNAMHRDIIRQARGANSLVIHEIENMMLLAGIYVVNFLAIMMTVLTSVDTLSGEINSGTVQTLVSKPLRRWEIVLGKYLGFAAMLLVYLLLMTAGVMGIIYAISGYIAPHLLAGVSMMGLNVLLLLGVSLAGGSLLSTLANGVLIFGLYGVAFIGGWIEQFGAILQNQTAIHVGVISSLIIPSESLWRRAAYEMQSPLTRGMSFSPFSSLSVPSPMMVVYAVIYAACALFLAVRLFRQRDL